MYGKHPLREDLSISKKAEIKKTDVDYFKGQLKLRGKECWLLGHSQKQKIERPRPLEKGEMNDTPKKCKNAGDYSFGKRSQRS